MSTIFSKIISGEIPSYKIAENKNFLAFLDVYPLVEGHTLVIPKKEIDNVFDIDDKLFTEYNLFAKKIAIAIGKAIECQRVGSAVVGLEIPHAHIHIVPLNNMDDINFTRPKLKFTKEEFEKTVEKIKAYL